MSELGYVQKLIFSGIGILSALLVPWHADTAAAGSHRSVVPLVSIKSAQAQPADKAIEPPVQAAPSADDADELGDEVPFFELNEALTAARSRLAELTKAADIAKVANELREKLEASEAENRQLKSALSQLQTDNSDLLSAQQAADGRIEALTKNAQEAKAEAERLDEQLVSIRWQNSQLSSELSQAETSAREKTDELGKVRDELGARAETLEAAVDQSAAEITRLQRELDLAKEQTLIAERQQAAVAAELDELRKTTDESSADSARLAKDLDRTITELASTRTALTAKEQALEEATSALQTAEDESGALREQLAASRSQSEELQDQMESAKIDLENYRTLNASLEQQVDLLKTAAGEATDAARQNLLAVENRINEINAALASVKADELLPGTGDPASGDEGGETNGDGPVVQPAISDQWIPRPSPRRTAGGQQIGSASGPESRQAGKAAIPLAGTGSPPSSADATDQAPAINLASLTTDLPANQRQDAEALLGELKAARDKRGLSMTVPGELLFAVNSETIEPAAFDALASVAKLVDLYEERDVLIVGHTDAVGDAGYNQQLSERRAALVKQYFVDNFKISAERLQIEGKGEQDPISSNATLDGRNANRRVEVVILD